MCLCEWMTCPAQSKWRALLCSFTVPHNDWRQTQKGEPGRWFIPTCQCQETPNVPVRGVARRGQSVWTELSFPSHLSLVPLTIVWRIRTTNLICWITDSMVLWFMLLLFMPHIWEQDRTLTPGMSLRLEVTLLAACLRNQRSESESLSRLCLWSMWREALLLTMRFLRTQIGNCRIWSDWKCKGLLPLVALALSGP